MAANYYCNNDLFPPNLDLNFYRNFYDDLRNFADCDLRAHWEDHGRDEGRLGSLAATRDGFVSILRNVHPALELGPFDRPVLPPAFTKFFDILSTQDLRRRAAELPDRDPARVPEINYVSSVGDLSIIEKKFSLVFSSHTVEHTPDLINHLKQVEYILEEGGIYAALIPDCRYCFDHYLCPSNIAHILEAHIELRRFHKLSSIIEHRALTTHNNPALHWEGEHGVPDISDSVERINAAIAEWNISNESYIDVHAWQFTPKSFTENISIIKKMGLINLNILRIYDTPRGSNEFCIVLEKTL
jgi:hypothetical protein